MTTRTCVNYISIISFSSFFVDYIGFFYMDDHVVCK